MEVQSYHREGEDFALAEQAPEDQSRRHLAQQLGFKNQADRKPSYPDDAARVFGELTGKELRMWQRFLPTHYSQRFNQWSGYTFDVIPLSALQEIETAKNMQIFDDIEIWTPERQTDPMAVGLIYTTSARDRWDARFFPIVRWGESLAPPEEIAKIVKGMRIRRVIGWTITLCIIAAIIYAIFWA